jgi:Tfp pilus assembly protein PilV
MLKTTQKNTGFSLIELLIAMAILIFAIVVVILLAGGNRTLSVDAQTDAEGLTVAQKFILSSQALARKDFRMVNATSSVETIGGLSYTKTTTVTPLADFFTKNLKTTVAWQGTYGRAQSVTLSALVTNFENAVGGDTCYSTLQGNWTTPQTTNKFLGADLLSDATGIYPITDVDAYQKKLYVTVNTPSTASGPIAPTTAINNSGVGTVSWTTPAGALVSGGTTADAALSNANPTSQYLWATGFSTGLSVPTGATILGIEVHVFRKASAANAIVDNQVRLIKPSGALSASDRADTTTKWATGTTNIQYGSANDLWGESWTPNDFKSANFGVAFSAKSTVSPNRTASVDFITVTVTYVKQLYVLDITNPIAPTLSNSISVNTVATGFTAVASDGKYAYVATNSGTGPMQVIDTSVSPAVVKATYSIAGNTSAANTIFYKDGYLYLGLANSTAKEFNIVDVHNPLSPTAVGSGFEIGAGVKSIYVRSGYAYITTDDNTREMVVLSVSTITAPTLVGLYDAPGSTGFGFGQTLYTVGDTLYLGRTYVSNGPEFAALDITTPATPTLLGSRDVGPNSTNPFSVYGILARDYLTFILTGSPSQGGQLFAINNGTPTTFGTITPMFSVTLPNSGAGTALDCEGNYLYAASVPATGANINKGSVSIVTAP